MKPMAHQLAFPIIKVITDNLSLVMMFAYSQPPLREFRRNSFTGGWELIDEVLFGIPEQLATRAMIELVLLFRTLDDHEDLDDDSLGSQFGTLHLKSGNIKPLSIRDVANKTIHALQSRSMPSDAGFDVAVVSGEPDTAPAGPETQKPPLTRRLE